MWASGVKILGYGVKTRARGFESRRESLSTFPTYHFRAPSTTMPTPPRAVRAWSASPPGMLARQAKGIDAETPPAEEALVSLTAVAAPVAAPSVSPLVATADAPVSPRPQNGPIPFPVNPQEPADAPPPTASRKRKTYGCGTCGAAEKRTCPCKRVRPTSAPVTTTTTSLGFPAFATAVPDQISVLRNLESTSKDAGDALYQNAKRKAQEINPLFLEERQLRNKLATVRNSLRQLATGILQDLDKADKAREEESMHLQAWNQLERNKMPKADVYDHRVPSGGNASLCDIMERINEVYNEYIKDTEKKFYVGIVNSLERLKERLREHEGKFNHLIMLLLHEMGTGVEISAMESSIITHVKVAYKDRCVNINDGGNGVTESKVNDTRFCLYMCFEA